MKTEEKSHSPVRCPNCLKKDLEIIQLMEEVIELSKEKDQLLQELSKTKDKMIAFFESQPPKPQMKVVFRR